MIAGGTVQVWVAPVRVKVQVSWRPLVTQSLHDVDYQVRHAALASIGEERHGDALPYYLQGLRNGLNEVVRRAGVGLEEVADERAIPDLIKALITTHQYRIQVRDDAPSYSFSTGGTYVNFLTEDESAERIKAALGPGLARLAEVKARWDPQNVFRTNRNVTPV